LGGDVGAPGWIYERVDDGQFTVRGVAVDVGVLVLVGVAVAVLVAVGV
jgi:hypothetical protein